MACRVSEKVPGDQCLARDDGGNDRQTDQHQPGHTFRNQREKQTADLAGMFERERTLAKVVQQQSWKCDAVPRQRDIFPTEVAHVRVECFRSGDGQDHGAQNDFGVMRMTEEQINAIAGIVTATSIAGLSTT